MHVEGKKEGSGGRVLKLLVAISYNKGVIACHSYEKLDGQFFENFVKANFASFFRKAGKGLSAFGFKTVIRARTPREWRRL